MAYLLNRKGWQRVEQRIRVLLTRNHCHSTRIPRRMRAEELGRSSRRTSTSTALEFVKVGDASFSKISAISAWEKLRSNPRDFRGLAFLYHHREKVAFPMVLSMQYGHRFWATCGNTMLITTRRTRGLFPRYIFWIYCCEKIVNASTHK